MQTIEILYDSLQEYLWFQSLDRRLARAPGFALPSGPSGNAKLDVALAFDRPDIILTFGGVPKLIVERSEEVPSGHNVGQRFARLVAAARSGAACIYLFPFVARKHGGETAGPRYVNLRLIQAMERVEAIYDTAVLAVNWPVDASHEVLKVAAKDAEMRRLVAAFINTMRSPTGAQSFRFSAEAMKTRAAVAAFAQTMSRRLVYELPPGSLQILPTRDAARLLAVQVDDLPSAPETVVYEIGMTYVRSDPYAGMAMLYDYLYAREGAAARSRSVVLHCPKIRVEEWSAEARKGLGNKSIRLYVEVADLIVFADGYLTKDRLLSG